MKTSRQRLLEYIQTHRSVTVAELSRVLQMTAANARHHLSILEQQGLVEVVGVQSTRGRGRAARVYGLSQGTLGHNLDRLADALLKEVFSRAPVEESDAEERVNQDREILRRVAARLLDAGPEEFPSAGGSLTQRLFGVVQRLNALNYQARWEAHAEAPRLILGHCPYATLLPEHPELCQMDAFLLERLVERPVQQTACQVPDARGVPHCRFAILIGSKTPRYGDTEAA